MELPKKSKNFGFKCKKQNPKELKTWFDNSLEDENEIFGSLGSATFHMKDLPRTPVRSLYKNSLSPISQNSSPQFKVGWNDGSQKNTCDMSSPVSVFPVRRKIRRCPENLLSKISTPLNDLKVEKVNEENGCDILQCISWAKNLIESSSTNFQANDNEDAASHTENVNKITESIKDTNLDILDDSSNELMIMCSQAIEESISVGSLLVNNAENSTSFKHSITPTHDRDSRKRFKREPSPEFQFSTKNPDNRLSHLNSKPCLSCSNDDLTSKHRLRVKNTSLRNEHEKREIFLKPTSTCNNNNTSLKNLNRKNTNFSSSDTSMMRKQIDFAPSLNTDSTLPKKSVSAPSNDDIKSHLDDEDDVFCSLDFNFLDSLQTQRMNSSGTALKPSADDIKKPVMKSTEPLKIQNKPNITKYTKAEIEKRRLEAKKRLIFSKKHRSM